MQEKRLGKITCAEFGQIPEYPFLFGLQLTFSFDGSGVGCGGKYTVNISPECGWDRTECAETVLRRMEHINKTLADAKVNYVSKLINKPVEVTLENRCFKSFKILTEVI